MNETDKIYRSQEEALADSHILLNGKAFKLSRDNGEGISGINLKEKTRINAILKDSEGNVVLLPFAADVQHKFTAANGLSAEELQHSELGNWLRDKEDYTPVAICDNTELVQTLENHISADQNNIIVEYHRESVWR